MKNSYVLYNAGESICVRACVHASTEETKTFYSVVQASLELEATCFSLPSPRITGMHHVQISGSNITFKSQQQWYIKFTCTLLKCVIINQNIETSVPTKLLWSGKTEANPAICSKGLPAPEHRRGNQKGRVLLPLQFSFFLFKPSKRTKTKQSSRPPPSPTFPWGTLLRTS